MTTQPKVPPIKSRNTPEVQEEKPKKVQSNPSFQQFIATSFSGPLPPPEAFEKYERTLPGTAERIVKLVEEEASHRRNLEEKKTFHNIVLTYMGLTTGAILAASIICGTVYVSFRGYPEVGMVLAGGGAATLVAAFLRNHFSEGTH